MKTEGDGRNRVEIDKRNGGLTEEEAEKRKIER